MHAHAKDSLAAALIALNKIPMQQRLEDRCCKLKFQGRSAQEDSFQGKQAGAQLVSAEGWILCTRSQTFLGTVVYMDGKNEATQATIIQYEASCCCGCCGCWPSLPLPRVEASKGRAQPPADIRHHHLRRSRHMNGASNCVHGASQHHGLGLRGPGLGRLLAGEQRHAQQLIRGGALHRVLVHQQLQGGRDK